MPALFSLGINHAPRETRRHLRDDEMMMAYLDDLYVITEPSRAKAAYDVVTDSIHNHCGICPKFGKIVCYSMSGGACSEGMKELDVWKADLPANQNGIRILG